MADKKISQLTSIPALDGADVLAVVDDTDTTTKKVSIAQLDGRYVMETDASTEGMAFVLDEDDMASNSATKVPTQQSVKAYVTAVLAPTDPGGDDGNPGDSTDGDNTSSLNIDIIPGTDLRLYVFAHVLSPTITPTGCTAKGVALTLIGSQKRGNVNLYAYELPAASFPVGDTTIDVAVTWSAVPDTDVMVETAMLSNVTGATSYVTGTQSTASSAAIASYGEANNADPLLIPYPSGIEAGDLLVLAVASDDPVTLPAGFTSRSTQVGAGAQLDTLVATKAATGSETGTLSVTTADALASGILMRVPDATFDVIGASIGDTAPSVTAAGANSLLVLMHFRHGPQIAPSLTVPAGTTELYTDTSNWRSLGVAYKQVGAGATGTQAFTMSGEFDSVSTALVLAGSGSGGTLVEADITTTQAGEVVVACCAADSAADYPTTVFGTMSTQLVDTASSTRLTVNTSTGSAGLKAIDWTFAGDGVVSNASALTLRVAPVVAVDPEPDIGSGTTIWNTKIATTATLQPTGFVTSGTRPDTGATISNYAMQIEAIYAIQLLASGTNVDVKAVKMATQNATQAQLDAGEVFLSKPLPNTSQAASLAANNLTFYYDTDAGTHTGTVRKIITGGGKYFRPSPTGTIYHNFESPPSNLHSQMGTWDEPGRSGQTGAARLSQAGTFIRASEYDAAAGGDEAAIAHAFGFLVWCSPFLSRTNNGYRWPAFSADANYNQPITHNGSYNGSLDYMRMGALVCLESRVTGSNFAVLGQTGAFPNFARALAEALYLYGAYIGDNTAWPSYAITLDQSKRGALLAASTEAQRFSLRDMLASTMCVTSNSATTIGGAVASATRRS